MASCRDINCNHYTTDNNQLIRTCTKHDYCPLERLYPTMPSLAYRLQQVKENLARDEGMVGVVIFTMYGWPEISQVGLYDLAWALSRDNYLHKNDVLGLIELLEERWKNR